MTRSSYGHMQLIIKLCKGNITALPRTSGWGLIHNAFLIMKLSCILFNECGHRLHKCDASVSYFILGHLEY